MNGMHIEATGLTRAFGDPPVPALNSVDFSAPPASFTSVVGASGSGKSTLLRIIGGLIEPTEGSVTIGGLTPDELRRRKAVGWMAQRPALLPWRRVLDNISLAQSINSQRDRQVPSPTDLLATVGLAHVAHAYPGELSGGMQQRVALARTLAIGAPVWLMDEPFSSLDELTREALATDLLEIWASVQPTVVWVTHHIPEAVAMSDRIVLLTPRPGRVAGVLEIDLPRPRDPTSVAFQEFVREARSILALAHRAEAVA
jgi:NitT/TauT family transport system ATP-binding protein